MEFLITDNEANLRLDIFLTQKLGQSRSQIQKQIKSGLVLINNKSAKVHQFLRKSDIVRVQSPNTKVQSFGKTIINEDRLTAKPKTKLNILSCIKNVFKRSRLNLEPKIIYKDAQYLVLEKPSGLIVHETRKSEKNTLVNWLIKKFPEIAKISDPTALQNDENIFRPGIIHRLDKDVSGLMLVARTQTAFDYFKSQFKLKKIQKEYLALVHGQLPRLEGSINFEISRSSSGERMASHPEGSGLGKPAMTQYEVAQLYKNFTLVKARPQTGRTNQIRVHFLALGFPIVGDPYYQIKNIKSKVTPSRIFLHAHQLAFIDVNGQAKSFTSALPEELEKILENLIRL